MKIIARIPYNPPMDAAFRCCDLCDASEYDESARLGPSNADFIPMFKAEEDGVEYTLCGECVDKKLGDK